MAGARGVGDRFCARERRTMIQNAILIGISTAVLMSGAPALAQDVLQGSDAFGGYTANEPGTRRLITPDDLPPPNAA